MIWFMYAIDWFWRLDGKFYGRARSTVGIVAFSIIESIRYDFPRVRPLSTLLESITAGCRLQGDITKATILLILSLGKFKWMA